MKDILGKILLASNSPRRFKLLSEAGFDVEIVKGKGIKEIYPENLPVKEIPSFLSRLKATPYIEIAKERNLPLVTADTIVILDGEAIGKPKDERQAIEMLHKLSGEKHIVITGVTTVFPDSENMNTFSVETSVRFRKLPDKLIEIYVDRYHPTDKAGSYGIQEFIGLVGVEYIEGDYYNIMGFPVCNFVAMYLSKYPSLLSEKFSYN